MLLFTFCCVISKINFYNYISIIYLNAKNPKKKKLILIKLEVYRSIDLNLICVA